MTEERFEQVMEHFGDAVEKTAENAANILDKSMNKAWSFWPVRLIGKTLTFCSGVGLMASYIPLKENGHPRIAKICLVSGGVIVGAQIVELLIFKKNRGTQNEENKVLDTVYNYRSYCGDYIRKNDVYR